MAFVSYFRVEFGYDLLRMNSILPLTYEEYGRVLSRNSGRSRNRISWS